MQTAETALTKASENLLMRHLKSFQDNNLDEIVGDYTEHSTLITPKKIYKGISQIREFFATLMVDFPKQNTSLELDTVKVQNELAFIVWHAKTPSIDIILGTDTFIIKENKILQQTFVDMVKFSSY